VPADKKYFEFDITVGHVKSVEMLRGVFLKCPPICKPNFWFTGGALFRHFNQLIDAIPWANRLRVTQIRQFGRQLDKYPEHLVPHSSKLWLYSNLALVTHKTGTHKVHTHDELGLKYDPDFFAKDNNSPYPKAMHPRIMVGPTDAQLFQLGNVFVHNYLPTKQLNNCTLSFIMIAFSVLLNPHYLEITEKSVGDCVGDIFPIGWLHSQQANTGKTFTIKLMEALMGVHTMVAAGGSIAHGYRQIGYQGGLCAINMDDVPQTAEVELKSLSRTIAQNGTNGKINTAGTAEFSKRIGSMNATANWMPSDGPMLTRLFVGKFKAYDTEPDPEGPRAAPDGLFKILNMLAPKLLAFDLNSGYALKRTVITKH
jgi:hypothetical protein